MDKNRKLDRDIDRILDSVRKKHLFVEEEIKKLLKKDKEEIVLPVSIFNEKLGMLEAASLYLKDELNLSFNDYKTIWTSYNKAKKKLKNEK